MNDLTGFQRDCLRAIARLNTENSHPPHGLAVKDWLEQNMDSGEVHHGRLYPNLDTLVEKGLVSKSKRDKRTNEYRITQRGQREIQAHLKECLDAADGLDDVDLPDAAEASGLDALFPENDADEQGEV